MTQQEKEKINKESIDILTRIALGQHTATLEEIREALERYDSSKPLDTMKVMNRNLIWFFMIHFAIGWALGGAVVGTVQLILWIVG